MARYTIGQTVEVRLGFGGIWGGRVGVVEDRTPSGNILDIRFPGERHPLPFDPIELRPCQEKLELYP